MGLLLATYPDRTRTMSFGLYLVLLQVGFTLPMLLPAIAVRSYRTISPLPHTRGGIFSVALAVSSHFPDVTWHFALRSPDFPPIIQRYQRSFSRLSSLKYYSHTCSFVPNYRYRGQKYSIRS